MHALLGDQRTCRTALALSRNGNALLAQPGAKISFVQATLNLLGRSTQLLVRKDLFRLTGKDLELEYVLLH